MTTTAIRLRAILWIALGLGLVAVTAASQGIHYRHLWVSSEIEQIQQDIVECTAATQKDAALQQRAKGLEHRTYANDKRILKMLRECRSREDFVVREGPRIVWSELRGSSATAKTIGVYLPKGKHRLKVGVANVSPGNHSARREFQMGNARAIAPVLSIGLGPDAEVYEIRLQSSADAPVEFSVHGKGNARLHASNVPGLEGPCRIRTLAEERTPPSKQYVAPPPTPVRDAKACYPSELTFNPNSGRDFPRGLMIKPVTDVALYFIDGQSPADVRIWIESDARPCLPAITVAAHYPTITGGAYSNQTSRDRERVFSSLFYPHDGSDRFYLREELFVE